MKRRLWKSIYSTCLIISLLIAFLPLSNPVSAAETRNLVILGTSDVQGNIDNYDYFSDSIPTSSARCGLTKIATYVNTVRASNPNTILIDNGDMIQGTPLAYYITNLESSPENHLAGIMNAMGYDAMTVGNHEFNYGPAILNKFQETADFPLLSANIDTTDSAYDFEPYKIKDVNGVQVGILGLTPPAVKYWEKPENIQNLKFPDPVTIANQYVPEMRAAGADIIVVAAHSGIDETYGYGQDENFVKYLANGVPGIDVILAGHAHALVASQVINGVLVTEPSYDGRNISDIRIKVTGAENTWSVTEKTATAPSVADETENAAIYALNKPDHDLTVTYINTTIGTATAAFPGGFAARIADGPMADLINQVQTESAAAAGFPVDASLAALFTNQAQLAAGPIKLKDAFATYVYDNTLYVVEATGQMIKDELEWTANYFNQYYYEPTGVSVNSKVRDYYYDMWSGITYKLDVTKPAGQRVVELKLKGRPLAMNKVLRVAVNNFRATSQFPKARRLYQSTVEIRDLITQWITAHGTISPSDVFVKNWSLLPPINTWLAANAGNSITRSDNADLLSTAFDRSSSAYTKLPVPGTTLTRESALYLLSNVAMSGLHDISTNLLVLNSYLDKSKISGWAKSAVAFTIQAGIFMPGGNKILPKQITTNAEALAWVREARYPLYTFVSTNDFHGQLETGMKVSNKPVGGTAYNMTYINNYRALNPLGTALFDAGDMMQGTPISSLLKGRSTIDVFNQMGYQASVPGNHEFDWGLATLQERMAQADFPILVANIFTAGTDLRPTWAKPTAMFTIKGQQIGVIGVTSVQTPSIVMAGSVAGLEFRAPGPIVSQLAAGLRSAGADLVIVLAHMPDVYSGVVSGEITTVAVPGVDLIISGHSHSGYSGEINDIPIIQQYSSGTAIGVSDLRYDRLNRNVATSKLEVVTTYNLGVTPDASISALVADYQDEVAPIVNEVKASTLGPITRAPNAFTMEVPMGNLIADAQAWKGGTQIAFMNPGGMRADIAYTAYPHNITYGDFLTVQPFDNKLVTMALTGSQIYSLLEQQFASVPTPATTKLLQVSGIKYTYDLSKPKGERIISLQLKDGTPIPKDATTYTVTCNEYIATGGDGFSTFLSGTNVNRIGVSDLDALIEFVQFKYGVPPNNTPFDPAVYPKIEGRISEVG
jgi:2',3'-cyclic-nucleotide 2'-phosphodiesterase (5'-nucleotidase family)